MIFQFLMIFIASIAAVIKIFIGLVLPGAEVGVYAYYLLTEISKITIMGGELVHFLLGDGQQIIVPMVIILVQIKIIVYPVVKIVTRLMPMLKT